MHGVTTPWGPGAQGVLPKGTREESTTGDSLLRGSTELAEVRSSGFGCEGRTESTEGDEHPELRDRVEVESARKR